ncbi:hypothetical protein GGR42_000465 [Saonia flava]|uniref:Uncharacterized protein n=1 Tax=Saonia flava TaxID=523696 RepID=A0A846QUM4_9FLAO|nr:hypothetical protein [Saonia flava]
MAGNVRICQGFMVTMKKSKDFSINLVYMYSGSILIDFSNLTRMNPLSLIFM